MCITRPSEAVLVDAVRRRGVRVVELNRRCTLDIVRWRGLLRFMRHEHVDVLHAHKFGSNVWGSLLGRLLGVRVVVAHEHTWSFDNRPVRRFLDRRVVGRLADVILTVSEADRRRMIEIEGVSPRKVRFVRSGILETPIATDRASVRVELGVADEVPLVGMVGSFRPQKRVDVLIQAMTRVRGAFPEARVVLIGGGQERAQLEELASRYGLADAVAFAGERPHDRIPALLSAFDVCVSSSDFEGTPLAVMEYMASGKAIVATEVGGVPELITNEVHGLLVSPDNPAQLAGGIVRFLQDPTFAEECGQRARVRQLAEFDFGSTVSTVADIYLEFLADRSASTSS